MTETVASLRSFYLGGLKPLETAAGITAPAPVGKDSYAKLRTEYAARLGVLAAKVSALSAVKPPPAVAPPPPVVAPPPPTPAPPVVGPLPTAPTGRAYPPGVIKAGCQVGYDADLTAGPKVTTFNTPSKVDIGSIIPGAQRSGTTLYFTQDATVSGFANEGLDVEITKGAKVKFVDSILTARRDRTNGAGLVISAGISDGSVCPIDLTRCVVDAFLGPPSELVQQCYQTMISTYGKITAIDSVLKNSASAIFNAGDLELRRSVLGTFGLRFTGVEHMEFCQFVGGVGLIEDCRFDGNLGEVALAAARFTKPGTGSSPALFCQVRGLGDSSGRILTRIGKLTMRRTFVDPGPVPAYSNMAFSNDVGQLTVVMENTAWRPPMNPQDHTKRAGYIDGGSNGDLSGFNNVDADTGDLVTWPYAGTAPINIPKAA